MIAESPKKVVGIFTTGNVFGDSAVMLPLVPFQAYERQPGGLSLFFVQVRPGADVAAVKREVAASSPILVPISNLTEFGRADRDYQLITAADRAATVVAVIIGAIIVMNAMLLSLVERYREFGILRAIGWSRRRVVALVLGEAITIGFAGAALGVALAYVVITVLAGFPASKAFSIRITRRGCSPGRCSRRRPSHSSARSTRGACGPACTFGRDPS